MTTLDLVITEWLGPLGEGLLLTLQLLAFSVLFGTLLAVPLALMRSSTKRWIAQPVRAYTYFMRSTPMLVQLLAIYYGIGQFEWMQAQWEAENPWFLPLREPFVCAVLAFTLNTGAYTAEIIAGAIRNTPSGDAEAASALGMSPLQILWHITLPSALRSCLPGYGNEVILMLQSSAIASAVTLLDLTGAARQINAKYYAPFEVFTLVGLAYLILTLGLTWLFHQAERRWTVHLQTRRT